MIENIKHDLNYFKEIVNDGAKDHLNGTIKKIDEYNIILFLKIIY